MDDAKVWTPIVLLAVLIGGIFLYRHLDLVDKANADLIHAKEFLRSAESSLKAQTTHWEGVSKAVGDAKAKLADATSRHDKAAAALVQAETLQRKTESDLAYFTDSFPAAVDKTRIAAIGTVLPVVILGDGKRLMQAQIKKIEESGISFIHSEGFGVVNVDNLPADLLEKFDLGSNSLQKLARQIKESLSEPVKSAQPMPSRISTPVDEAPAAPKKLTPDEEKLKRVRIQIVDLTAKRDAAARNLTLWENAAVNFATQAESAAQRGVPTSKHRADEANARAQIVALNHQIGALDAEIGRLRVEENSLRR